MRQEKAAYERIDFYPTPDNKGNRKDNQVTPGTLTLDTIDPHGSTINLNQSEEQKLIKPSVKLRTNLTLGTGANDYYNRPSTLTTQQTPSNIAAQTPANYNPMIELGNMMDSVEEEDKEPDAKPRKARKVSLKF